MTAWNDPDILTRAQLTYQRLQLPVPSSLANVGRDTLWESFILSFDGVDAEDALLAFETDTAEWVSRLDMTARLLAAIDASLNATVPDLLQNKRIDFPAFITGIAEAYSLSPQEAVKLGSQLSLVKTLSEGFEYSSSSITTILGSKIEVEKLNTYLVQEMGKFVGVSSEIEREDIDRIFANDTRLSPSVFADSELSDIIETLDLAADTLNMPRIGKFFVELAAHDPYVQMLHWQTILVEVRDFDPSLLYEFSPRGVVAKHLFEKHEAVGLGTGGNPFLNNAKSAYAADTQWAMQKKPAQRGLAISLSDTLQSLKYESYPSRRSMATLIRWAIHKLLDIRANTDQNLITPLNEMTPNEASAKISNWLDFTSAANTETRGIFEQRAVDYIVHRLFEGQVVEIRGLKDSVNASNLSRMKFGDEEVMDIANRTITAFEPHGGALSQVYIDEHLRSMAKVLEGRRDELEMVAAIPDWSFNVTFVAHSSHVKAQVHMIADAKVDVRITTYSELIEQVEKIGHASETFDDLVTNVVNKPGVSLPVRTKAHKLLME